MCSKTAPLLWSHFLPVTCFFVVHSEVRITIPSQVHAELQQLPVIFWERGHTLMFHQMPEQHCFFFFTHFLHSLARNSRSLHLTELILIRGCPVSYSATAPLISVEFCWFTHNQIHCSVNSYYCSQSLTDERMIPSHGKKIKIKTNQIQRIQKKC